MLERAGRSPPAISTATAAWTSRPRSTAAVWQCSKAPAPGRLPSGRCPGLGVVVAIAAGDVSGDDAADLLLAIDSGSTDAPENAVLRNERNGTFSSMLRFGATKTAQLLVADVNADRLADVVALNATGVHQVYFGDRTSGLALQPEFLLDPGTATAELADLDADGVPDLFVAGAAAPNVVVLRNSGIGRFGLGDVSPPAAQARRRREREHQSDERVRGPGRHRDRRGVRRSDPEHRREEPGEHRDNRRVPSQLRRDGPGRQQRSDRLSHGQRRGGDRRWGRWRLRRPP